MEATKHVKLADRHHELAITDVVDGKYRFSVDSSVDEKRVYFDTFDWLLYVNSYVLYQSGDDLVLSGYCDSGQATRACVDRQPAYAADLPTGQLRDRVQSAAGVRALLKLAAIDVHTAVYRILNEDEKTVARLVHTRTAVGDQSRQAGVYVSVLPVRGYARDAEALARGLPQSEEIASAQGAIFLDALDAAGMTAGSYSARLGLQLEPHMRSDEAAKAIMRRLLEIMRANEDGIRRDIDIEFLHDYRVAVRKTRSALSQIRDVFPADVTERFKQGFRSLGQGSNALRDFDVYLHAADEYRAMLPDALREDIGPLFEYLQAQRAHAVAQVIGSMDSPDTQRLLRDWAEFLAKPGADTDDAPNAGVPILELSRRRIYGTYQRIVKRGEPLVERAEDAELHALRIEGKKLRYLLEFFASLYPPKQLAGLIQELKKLQDNLGEFNDLSVQEAYLLHVAGELPVDDPRTPRALVATGALVEALARRQDEVRAEFAVRFDGFASKRNRKLYRDLFGGR